MVGVPSLVMSGRSVAPDNFEIFQPYMRPGYLELLRRRPAAFTNNSRAGAADYARWLDLPVERFRVVHNGFDFPTTKPIQQAAAFKEGLGIPAAAPVVGTIIRFSEEKQPHLWIETAVQVAAQMPAVYFVAFGDGVMLEEIRERVRILGLGDRIKLPGITKDAWASLSLMQVFLLTSRMEGLPNVLIEAQAMGVPVVTTGQGGMLETYQQGVTGLTANASVDSLASQIIRLLSDPGLLQSMSKAASHYARTQFDVETMLRSTLGVFDEARSTPQQNRETK
jgi:glycosyltransferase involved in cell wall biosynthesis